MNKILAFVPARGGSKGILKKNLYPLNGKPLIQYTLDVLDGLGDIIIPFISTEDNEIKDYCELNGFSNDYIRPKKLAKDETSTIDSLIDALDWIETNNNLLLDSVLVLQPTSPLRATEQVKEAIDIFNENNLSSIVSVSPMEEHPYKCIKSDEKGWRYLEATKENISRRQEYSDNYSYMNGAIYIVKIKQIRLYHKFVIPNVTELFVMDKKTSVDIDSLEDVAYAEYIFNKNNI